MKAIFDQGPFAPCDTPFNLAEYVLAAGQTTPDKTALAVLATGRAKRIRYQEFRAAVLGIASGLLQTGAKPGDRVLLRLGNIPEFPMCFLAAIAVGLIPVPTSAQLSQPEIDEIARQIEPTLVLASEGLTIPSSNAAKVIDLASVEEMKTRDAATFERGSPDRPAYIVFTSGTSGMPRAVTHAHRAVWARRMMWDGWYGLGADDRLLHAGAFNWTYTLGTGILDPLAAGATALVPAPGVTPDQLPLLLKRHDATLFAAAPGVYRQLLRGTIPDLPKLRHGLSAGEKLPASILDAWKTATGLEIYEAFGMSECSTFISSSPTSPAPPHTLGRPQKGRRVALIGAEGPVDIGEAGTIAVHKSDPGLMLEYWGNEAETQSRYYGDWFLTGDRGVMDESYAIEYLGRDDDMMNAGGYRVSPLEVEAAMSKLPGISECAAIEVEVKSDVRVIALYFAGSADPKDPALVAHAEEHLARYKQPRIFRRVDALPRSANGKILRKALRQTHG